MGRTTRCQSVVAAGPLLGQETFRKIETLLELRDVSVVLVFHVGHVLDMTILQLGDPTLELFSDSTGLSTRSHSLTVRW